MRRNLTFALAVHSVANVYIFSAVEHQGWDQFVGEQVRKWKMVVAENMLKNRGHPVLLVQYEQLKTSPLVQVGLHEESILAVKLVL